MDKYNNFCTIYLVRHGQSEANFNKILAGHLDVLLTEKGKEQAKLLGEKLKDIKFDAVYSSDLLRAKHTAEIITLEKSLAIQTSHLIRERNFGNYDGKKREEFENEVKQLGEDLNEFVGESEKSVNLSTIESDESLMQRTFVFLREVAVANPNKTILVVVHGGLLRTLLVKLGFGTPHELPFFGSLDNAAFIKLISDGVDFIIKETQGVNKRTEK